MVADEDCEDEKEVAQISWYPLIQAADGERTEDRGNFHPPDVILLRLFPALGVVVSKYRIEDTINNEIEECYNAKNIGNGLLVEPCL